MSATTATEPPALHVAGLSHSYGAAPVLVDVALDIEAGETIALLGPSGCGKTTLLRSIAGLERPSTGTVVIGDVEVSGPTTWIPPERRRVGMVFQDWALFPHLSVGDNVAYGLPRGERSGHRVNDALSMVGLADLSDRMPHTLSGGQQQRVALARALAPRPSVLLLDEPFSNLDSSLRVEVRTDVHRLLHELHITSVFVTHDQDEAFVLGDRVAVMREGQIVQSGTPPEIYHRPVDRWTAEFVGSASVVRGTAASGCAATAIGSIPVANGAIGEVEVLLRPESLELTDGDDAEVELVEFYGHDAMVFVVVDGQRMLVRTGPFTHVARGDRVGLRFVGEAASTFPIG